MEIGFNLLEKSISAYRSLLTDSAPQKGIDDALIEIILTKVISGSDFLNGTRFLRDIIRDYKDGKYSDRIFGIAMNCLIKYQSGFVRFDNFNERQATLEKSVQNRALMLAKDLKDILNLAMLPERKSMPWPLLSATLFYYRFLLGRILAEKARNHILASQLDNIADSAATPNDFGLFRRTRNNGQSDGGAPTTGFDPIIIKFERLARPYGKSAGELAESCESGSYSEYSTL